MGVSGGVEGFSRRRPDFWLPKHESSPSVHSSRLVGAFAKVGFVLLLIVTANDYFLKLYNIPGVQPAGQTILELGDDGGIRTVSEILRNQKLPGDKIVPIFPHMLYLYYGEGTHYADNPLQIQVLMAERWERAVQSDYRRSVGLQSRRVAGFYRSESSGMDYYAHALRADEFFSQFNAQARR